MNIFQKIWHTITNNGVDETALGREVVKVRLLNQLFMIALLVSFINIPIYMFIGSWGLVYSSLANLALEIGGVYATYRKKYEVARFFAIFLFPTLEASHVMIHGVNLGNVFTAVGIMAFMLYEGKKKIQFLSIFYICTLFIASKYYVIRNFEDTFKAHIYSDLLLFPLVLMAFAMMILLYQKEIKKYEERQRELIDTLENKNKKLVEINDELEQFTYIASHDLKTPLRTIKSYVHLADRNLDKAEYDYAKMNLRLAQNGTQQMHYLIRDILEYKTINQKDEVYENIDLNEVMQLVLVQLKPLIEQNNAVVIYDKLPSIYARKNDLIVLFQNLIKNGIQYNETEKPTVSIITKSNDDDFILEFKDNGIGIDAQYHDKIFQFFKRLHKQEKYEGTGMGLGLCNKIVRNYSGVISLDSRKNNGSIFKIILPKKYLIDRQLKN